MTNSVSFYRAVEHLLRSLLSLRFQRVFEYEYRSELITERSTAVFWEEGFSSFAHNCEMLREFAACGSRGHPLAAAWQPVSPCCEVYSGCVSTDRARSWDWKPSRPEELKRAFKSTLESVEPTGCGARHKALGRGVLSWRTDEP